MLWVIGPQKAYSKRAQYQVDQFLMKGGTVLLSSSPFSASMSASSLLANEHASGLEDWLMHQGISFEKTLLMDAQNSSLPIPITRNLGGFSFQDFDGLILCRLHLCAEDFPLLLTLFELRHQP